MSTAPITTTPPTTPTAPTTPTTPTSNGLPSGQSLNNMFLQLLVAQLQNQDPTSPVDPSTFVGQLAQFSELSEVTSIYTLLQQVVPASGGSGGGASPVTGSPANAGANPAGSATPAPLAALDAFVPPAAARPLSNFSAPAISALTSKIQGAF